MNPNTTSGLGGLSVGMAAAVLIAAAAHGVVHAEWTTLATAVVGLMLALQVVLLRRPRPAPQPE